MPGAGPADLLILSMFTPPLAACNPEVVGSTPPPSIESKTVVFTVFFALQGCETQVKCTFLRFSGYHSIWVALIAFIQHEEKGFIVSASSNMAVLASIWGAFFFLVTFKLPFHALPLLSPHPASFRSFTPGASSRSPTWSCLTLFKARVMLFLGHISSHRGTKEMVECGVNLIKAEQTWWNIETQILLRMMGKYGNVLLILKTWRFLTACVSLFVYWARIKSRNYLRNPIDTI